MSPRRYNVRLFIGGARPSYRIVTKLQPSFYPLSNDASSGARWYPSLCTMNDGNILIVSGSTTERTVLHRSHCSPTSIKPLGQAAPATPLPPYVCSTLGPLKYPQSSCCSSASSSAETRLYAHSLSGAGNRLKSESAL